MMTNTTDRPPAERLVIRWLTVHARIDLAKTRIDTARITGILEGLGEAATCMGIVLAPTGFNYACNEALKAIPRPNIGLATVADEAARRRDAYYNEIIAHVRDNDLTNWED